MSETKISETIFEWLLRLYPQRFRSEYDEAMRLLFRDRLREEAGALRRMRLWMDLLHDLAISIPREHRRRERGVLTEPGVYRLSEEAIAKMIRGGRFGRMRIALLFMGVGFSAAWMGDASRGPLCAVYGVLAMLATAASVGHIRHGGGRRRYEESLRSWKITVDEERILAVGMGIPAHSLHKSEITKLMETDLGLSIGARSPDASMWVSSLITGYEELRARLASWAPVESMPAHPLAFMHGYGLFWIIGIFPAALLARSPYYATPLALMVGVPILHLMFVAARSGHLGTFKVTWLAPFAIVASLIVKLAYVLR